MTHVRYAGIRPIPVIVLLLLAAAVIVVAAAFIDIAFLMIGAIPPTPAGATAGHRHRDQWLGRC